MGRQDINMVNGDHMVVGYDRGWDTWFAQFRKAGSRHEVDAVIGYAPAEVRVAQAENPDLVVGPYPVDNPLTLCAELIPEIFGVEALPPGEQPVCFICKRPPWDSNPSCSVHPYNRLHDQ